MKFFCWAWSYSWGKSWGTPTSWVFVALAVAALLFAPPVLLAADCGCGGKTCNKICDCGCQFVLADTPADPEVGTVKVASDGSGSIKIADGSRYLLTAADLKDAALIAILKERAKNPSVAPTVCGPNGCSGGSCGVPQFAPAQFYYTSPQMFFSGGGCSGGRCR